MSAINVIVKPDAVHMLTDALSYIDGVPCDTDFKKSHPIAGMRAAISATGPAMLGLYLSMFLEDEFSSFDDLITNGNERIKDLFRQHVHTYRDGDDVATVVLIGWHERENRPAAYAIDLTTRGTKEEWVRQNSRHGEEDACRDLSEMPLIATPCPSAEEFAAAAFGLGEDLNERSPESILLHMMEIQRRMRTIDGDIRVGGHALATTVSEMGVTQRVVRTWPEDRVGQPIEPRPIDWARCRAERDGAGLPRLKRERLAKKALRRVA